MSLHEKVKDWAAKLVELALFALVVWMVVGFIINFIHMIH